MQRITFSSHLLKEPVKRGLNERQTILKEFLDTLNADRGIKLVCISPNNHLTKGKLYDCLGFKRDSKSYWVIGDDGIKNFYDMERFEKKGYPKLSASRVGVMLAPIKTKDLYAFLADCRYASHFGKYFWSRFKS